jgi:putative flippase GtrA
MTASANPSLLINHDGDGTQMPQRSPSTFARWMRFNFVGAIGVVVQFGALFILKGVAHIDYVVATVFAVEAAIVHNFVWHEQFTWADRIRLVNEAASLRWRSSMRRFFRFNLTTGAVSILGNVSLMEVMVGAGHMNYLVANGIAILLCSLANFVVSNDWVFEENHPE